MSPGACVVLGAVLWAACVYVVLGLWPALIVLAFGAGVLCGGWVVWLALESPTGDEGAP